LASAAIVNLIRKRSVSMQRHLSRVFAFLVSLSLATFATTAVAGTSGKEQDKVTKEYCKEHPDDQRCKEAKY